MQINIAKSAGFCFGVKRALDIAFKTALSGEKIYMLGDIVHNENVVRKIEQSGIKKIGKLKRVAAGVLLIRAHGAPMDTFIKANKLNYDIIDATCPMVKEIHKIVKDMRERGFEVIVIGDKLHEEVRGIAGQVKGNALVIDDIATIPLRKINKIEKACVVAQSTQNSEKVLKIVEILKAHIAELEFFNTICKPTRIKQEEIMKLRRSNDIIIIIGSKNSANSKRLYEISRSLNKKSWWVNSKEEIRSGWFRGAKSAGITAGASTPEYTIKNIVRYIRSLA